MIRIGTARIRRGIFLPDYHEIANADAGHASLLRLLLEARCSANVQRTKDGCSPLHCALVHGRHDAANVLVAHGASRALRNNAGERPDDLATS